MKDKNQLTARTQLLTVSFRRVDKNFVCKLVVYGNVLFFLLLVTTNWESVLAHLISGHSSNFPLRQLNLIVRRLDFYSTPC